MYKDVWKRIFAAVLTVCLVVTLIQWPTTVKAEEGKTYHDYQHGGDGTAEIVNAVTAAAVFTAGKNETSGAEILEGASFDVYISEDAAQKASKATVSYYVNPGQDTPDLGEFVCSDEIYNLVEGTNRIDVNISSELLEPGTRFAIVVTLQGEGISFYAEKGSEPGRTYIKEENGSWKDMYQEGQYLNIRATTYDEIRENPGIIDHLKSVFSKSAVETAAPASEPDSSAANAKATEEAAGNADNTEILTEGTEAANDTEVTEPETTDGSPSEGTETEAPNKNITETETPETGETGIDLSDTEKTDKADKTDKKQETMDAELYGTGDTGLNKHTMSMGVGATGDISLINPVTGMTYEWSIENSSVADVVANGDGYTAAVTAKAVGKTVIHAKEQGGTQDYACELIVTPNINSVAVDIQNTVYNGSLQSPVIELRDGEKLLTVNTDYTITFTPVADAGTYDVVIAGLGDYGGTRTEQFTIEQKSLKDPTIGISVDRTLLNTRPLEECVKVTDSERGTDLVLTTDYMLKEVITETGKAGVQAEGQSNYKESIEAEIPVSIESAVIELPGDPIFVYTGINWQPTVRVSVNGIVLDSKDGKDCTVTFTDNEEAGTATITVTGNNDYYGTATAQFEILQKDISNNDQDLVSMKVKIEAAVAPDSADPSAKPIPDLNVTYNGSTLVSDRENPSDYDYSIGEPVVTEIDGAKKGTLVLTGNGNYKGTYTVNYDIGKDIGTAVTGMEPITGIIYNGRQQEPAVTLKTTGVTITEGVDYKVIYKDNKNAGTATVMIEGIGSYGGTVTAGTFEIAKASMDDLDYSYEKSVVFSPLSVTDMKPEVRVIFMGQEVTEGYTLEYSIDSETSASFGSKTIEVKPTASGNFTGGSILNYEVNQCPLNDLGNPERIQYNLTNGDVFTYTGNPVNPGIQVIYNGSDGGTAILSGNDPAAGTTGDDYEVTFEPDYTNVSDNIKVTILGTGNYSGSLTTSIRITRIHINTVNVEADTAQEGWVTGDGILYLGMLWHNEGDGKLKLKITDKTTGAVIDPKYYKLEYENYDVMSSGGTSGVTAKVTITGQGNYAGSASYGYLIAEKLDDCDVSVESGTKTYTGDPIEYEALEVKGQGGRLLEAGVDYLISYDNNVDSSEVSGVDASATIEAVSLNQLPTKNGCYVYSGADKKVQKFEIQRRRLDEASLKSEISKEYAGGSVILQPDEIKLAYNGKDLTAPDDFSIKANGYNNNTNVTDMASALITGAGNFTGDKTIPFKITGKRLENAEVTVDSVTYNGEPQFPSFTLTEENADGTKVPLVRDTDYSYSQSDFSNNVNAGDTAKVTITGKGKYAGDTRDIFFTISPRDISEDVAGGGSCQVNGVISPLTYTSKGLEQPNLIVNFKMNGESAYKKLSADDYSVSYENNVNANVDSGADPAVIVIKGEGNYTGEYKDKTFQIAKKDIGDSDIVIADIPDQPFEGKKVEVQPEITYGDYKLQPGDYTLKFTNNLTVGTAAVKITGNGNFEGTAETSFRITDSLVSDKIDITCDEEGSSFVYKGSPYEPTVRVTSSVTGGPLVQGTDYEVTCENNVDVGTATVKVKGIGAYSGEKTFHFTITPKNIGDADVSMTVGGKADGSFGAVYTGSPIEPAVVLSYQGADLAAGEYVVTYGSESVRNINVGSVPVKVSATGRNFIGEKNSSFHISQKSIGSGNAFATGFSMDPIPPQGYLNGSEVKPAPQVYYNGSALRYGTDYSFTYAGNTAIGQAEIYIHGQNNYSGMVKSTFEIKPAITGATVTVPDVYFEDYYSTADGKAEVIFAPDEIKVTLGGSVLDPSNYEVSYEHNDKVGTATVIIKGKTTFAEEVRQNFKIKGKAASVEAVIGKQNYTGSPVEPKPVLSFYGTTLTENVDYFILEYIDNTNIGTDAAVKILLSDFYDKETITAKFEIAADGDIFDVTGIDSSYQYRGEAIQPEVTVKAGGKQLTEGTDYTVTYGSNINAGKGAVIIMGMGRFQDIIEPRSFDITPLQLSDLTILNGDSAVFQNQEYTGREIIPDISILYRSGNKTFTMPASDYTVTAKEGYQNIAAGEACVKISGNGNILGDRDIIFQIVKKDISKPAEGAPDALDVILSSYNYTYDGTEQKPSVTVKYKIGTSDGDVVLLREGTESAEGDYTLQYSENINAGKAVVTISGTGNYTGVRTEEFEIAALDITHAPNVAVTLINGFTYPYMGDVTGVTPEVEVTLNGTALKASTETENGDYHLEYSDNKALGTAAVTVHGDGNLTGTKTQNFTIEEHDITSADVIVADIKNQPYTGSPVFPEVKITCGDYELQQDKDFTLAFEGDHTEKGIVTVTITGTGGFKNSRTATFKIASGISDAEVTGLKDSYPFTGQLYTEELLGITEVRIGDIVLGADSYEFSFAEGSDGISAGPQTLLLSGQGEYADEKKFEIEIMQKAITDADVIMEGFLESIPYDETEVTQNITLKWGEISLEKDKDYTVSCKVKANGSNVYTMTVEGIGNYSGSIIKDFRIQQTDISAAEVSNYSTTYTYTGEEIKPEPVVKMNGAELQENVDYELAFEGNLNAGVAKMTISGISNYTGSLEISFKILKKNITRVRFEEIGTQVYTGLDVKPAVSGSDGGTPLAAGRDFTVGYENNRVSGTGTAVIKGSGNYTATKKMPFDIRPGNITAIRVTGASESTVSIGWASAGTVTGYEIYRAGSDGSYVRIARKKGASFTDTKLTSGKTYTYKIRAYVVTDTVTYYGSYSPIVTGNT